MATNLENKINRVQTNVTAALAALAEKGVSVPTGANSDDLETLIKAIESGGGGIRYGTFTLTEAKKNITIEHNLGSLPSFAMYVMKNGTTESNNTIFGCGGIPKVSYFRFGKTTSWACAITLRTNALTQELKTSNPCWIGSLNEYTMDVGVADNDNYFYLEAGTEYLWLVLP